MTSIGNFRAPMIHCQWPTTMEKVSLGSRNPKADRLEGCNYHSLRKRLDGSARHAFPSLCACWIDRSVLGRYPRRS
jgi:hypothetical protein